MSDIREVLRSEEGRSRRRERQPNWDEARIEGVHAERERQRLIQRDRARREETSDEPDTGSNEWF
jgi:hypothetical protein